MAAPGRPRPGHARAVTGQVSVPTRQVVPHPVHVGALRVADNHQQEPGFQLPNPRRCPSQRLVKWIFARGDMSKLSANQMNRMTPHIQTDADVQHEKKLTYFAPASPFTDAGRG